MHLEGFSLPFTLLRLILNPPPFVFCVIFFPRMQYYKKNKYNAVIDPPVPKNEYSPNALLRNSFDALLIDDRIIKLSLCDCSVLVANENKGDGTDQLVRFVIFCFDFSSFRPHKAGAFRQIVTEPGPRFFFSPGWRAVAFPLHTRTNEAKQRKKNRTI